VGKEGKKRRENLLSLSWEGAFATGVKLGLDVKGEKEPRVPLARSKGAFWGERRRGDIKPVLGAEQGKGGLGREQAPTRARGGGGEKERESKGKKTFSVQSPWEGKKKRRGEKRTSRICEKKPGYTERKKRRGH